MMMNGSQFLQNQSIDEIENVYLKPYVIVYIALFAVSAILGVAGNILIIAAIMSSKTLRNMRNAFIFNLALADLTVSGVTMPMSIIGVVAGRKWFEDYDAWCKLSAIVCAPGCVASTYSICWIAISRYYYICEYAVYLKHFGKSRIVAYVTSIWLLSFFVHMPNHVGWGMVQYSTNFKFCTFDSDHFSYSIYYASYLFLAIVLTAVFYVKLYLVLRTSVLPRQLVIGKRKAIRQAMSENSRASEMTVRDELRLAKASFKIFVAFLIFWAPVTVLILIALGDAVPTWLYLYSALAAHSNSTLNVFIYYFENKTFRRTIKRMFSIAPKSNEQTSLQSASKQSKSNYFSVNSVRPQSSYN